MSLLNQGRYDIAHIFKKDEPWATHMKHGKGIGNILLLGGQLYSN